MWRNLCFVGVSLCAFLSSSIEQTASAAARSVTVVITDRGFRPNQIIALINQPVQIHVINKGKETHQLSIPYYYIFTSRIQSGQMSDVTFTPYSSGRFNILSDPTGNNTPEFTATITVTDQK